MDTESVSPQRKLLESFVVGNCELERLEALLSQFNIFEAVGAVRQELRHSDFLAFLLDPTQSHGLNDAFAKRLIQKALALSQQDSAVSPIDLDVWNLDELLVQREWHNVDILLTDESHRLVVAIENKIGSDEHSEQLGRYRQTVNQHHVGWRAIFLYLTPEGDPPSDEAYLRIDYGTVCAIIEDLAQSRASTLGADVRTLMVNYTQMLRRHIVSESEIADLCRRIYQKHKRALDLIYEHRPDRHAEIREFLEKLIQQTPNLILDQCNKTYIRFCPTDWEAFPELKTSVGWTNTQRLLLFEFENYADYLRLRLTIGPGPQDIRKRLFEFAQQEKSLFKPAFKALQAKFNSIYHRNFLVGQSFDEVDKGVIEEKVGKEWALFTAQALPQIMAAITKLLQSGSK